jgi:hypothetical protein
LPLLALLAGLEQAARFGATHCYVHQAGKINLIMERRVDPELAIFGASNGLSDLDAPALEKATGESTFNFSMDGTPFLQYQVLIRELVASYPRCRHVVLAETFMTFMGLSSLRTPAKYLPWLGRESVYPVFAEIDPALAWKARYVPFYSFVVADQDYYKASLRGYLTLLGRPPANSEVQGYAARNVTWEAPPPAAVQAAAAADDFPEDPRAVRDFTAAIALLNRAGKQVFVVITPLEAGCLGSFPSFDRHREKLRALVGEGNVFLDYTRDPIASDKVNFHNCGHLNAHGAEALSRTLAADLVRLRR